MTNDEMRVALMEFIGAEEPVLYPGLGATLYSLENLGLWIDNIDSVSEEQCLFCWRIVEALRKRELPDELVM